MPVICRSIRHARRPDVASLRLPPSPPLTVISSFATNSMNAGESFEREMEPFIRWIERQPHRHKIVVAGNHDRMLVRIQSWSRIKREVFTSPNRRHDRIRSISGPKWRATVTLMRRRNDFVKSARTWKMRRWRSTGFGFTGRHGPQRRWVGRWVMCDHPIHHHDTSELAQDLRTYSYGATFLFPASVLS